MEPDKRPFLLLVAPDLKDRDALESLLADAGVDWETAVTLDDAAVRLAQAAYDLVVLAGVWPQAGELDWPPILFIGRADAITDGITAVAADILIQDNHQTYLRLLPRKINWLLAETGPKQNGQALREREEQFRGLAQTASDAIISISADSTIRYFNPAAERIFGFLADEALGNNLDIIIPEAYGQRHHQAVARYLRTGVPRILGQTIEIRGQRKNGEIFPIELSLSKSEVAGEIIFTGIIRDITERKQAEENLTRARATAAAQLNELNHIYDQVPAALGLLDRNMKYVRLNEKLAALNEAQVKNLIGKTFLELAPEWLAELEPAGRQVLATGQEARIETLSPHPQAASRLDWVVTFKPFTGPDGETNGLLLMVVDVTELKQAEREAKNRAYQQEIVARLGQQALTGLALPWLMDEIVNLTAVTLDVGFCKILELLPGEEEFLLKAGVGWQEGLVGHATVTTELGSQAGFTLVIEEPVIVDDLTRETRFSGPDLLTSHGVISGVSVTIQGDGRAYGVFGVHSDHHRIFTRDDVNFIQAVSNILAVAIQRQQAQDVLVESETRYRLLIETMNEGLVQTDREDVIQFVNPKFCEMLGYQAKELIGQVSWQILLDDEMEQEKIKSARSRRKKGISDTYILRARHKSGRPVWLRVHGSPVYDSIGNLVGTVGIQEDITDRLRAEKALQESENRLRKIFQAVPIGVSMVQERRIQFVNDAFCHMLGYKPNELVGLGIEVLFATESELERVVGIVEPLADSGETAVTDTRFVMKDGRLLDISLTSTLIDPEQPKAGVISTAVDITKQKKLATAQKAYAAELETAVARRTWELRDTQAQLVQQERMAVLGQLAGAVAHELRNPLGAVKNAIYLFNTDAKMPESEFKETLAIMEGEVERAEHIIHQLLAFARAKPPVRRKTQINQLIDSVWAGMKKPQNIELSHQLDESLPPVMADPDQLRQVFVNIIANSLQAMPDGGRITITTAREDGRWVVVTITDNGEGIAEDDQARLFEPLFTTRAKGIGLGLALAKNYVDALEGEITAVSSPGQETIITVKLPVAANPSSGPK